jgi:aspartate/methionine/tyrosine aminotransferase|tara:strand:- start:1978 stop:3138 length:1161 start_codon:yes stop_codon:yes gene_type:complete
VKLSKRSQLIQPQPMFEIMNRAAAIERNKNKKVIHLEIGNTSYFSNNKLIEILKNKISKNNIDYVPSEGLLSLRKKISEIFSKILNAKYTHENIIISSANSLITKFLNAVTEKKDVILLPSPCFSTYLLSAKFLELEVCYYPLNEKDNWQPDTSFINDVIKKKNIKAMVVNSPSNPLGKKINNDILKEINKICILNKTFLLIDNTYAFLDFTPKELKYKKSNYLFFIYSFSKDSSVPGLRAGFGIGDKNIINKIKDFNSMIESCYPGFIQEAILKYLNTKDNFYIKMKNELIDRVELLASILTNTKYLKIIKPDGGIFIFIKVLIPKIDGTSFAISLLEEKLVCVCPGKYFGSNHSKFFRLNIAASKRDLIHAANKIVEHSNFLAR